MQLPTPSTRHVSFDNVYEPAEDSYLFLDTLSTPTETEWLHARFSAPSIIHQNQDDDNDTSKRNPAAATPLVVELGPGSGVIVAFLTAHARRIFGHEGILSASVDVNWHACVATRTTVQTALAETKDATTTIAGSSPSLPNSSVYLASLNGDLSGMLRPGSADVVVFNPPYVPTESVPAQQYHGHGQEGQLPQVMTTPTFEESSHLLAQSYAGGRDGMEVTSRMLAQLPGMLSARGVAYVLFCRGNRPDEVKASIRGLGDAASGGEREGEGEGERRKWHAETVGESGKTAGWEKLEIVRIWRE
ncbi:hypothetical protein LTR84_012105 [Exophiala bonariae]|uniref:Methyltransferase small domain-containing protein n=1 Tax=Exophiala bonariae TaxID=1690606 RepID=A0AAV9NHI3_9EURO|nr:hypothetical protein LTR84_012105 [Exophiala bonariae]